MDPATYLALTKSALKNLGSTAEEQIAYLDTSGEVPVDELALEFEDTIDLAGLMCIEGVISEDQLHALLAVENLLGRISGEENASFWTMASLQNDVIWAKIRDSANAALVMLTAPPEQRSAAQ